MTATEERSEFCRVLLLLPERPSVATKACCVERVPWRGGTVHKATHDGAKDSETSLEL